MFQPFHEVVSHVSRTVREHGLALKRPVIGVMPAYFPMELIDAAGGYPVQLWGNNLPLGRSDAYLQSYCCTVARSALELELIGGADMVQAYAFTSLCDTLINLREIYRRLFDKPTIELSIPITQTPDARRVYLDSVLRGVVKDLEKITGLQMTPEALEAAADVHTRTRELQRELYRIRRDRPGLIGNYDFYTAVKAGFFLPRAVYNAMLLKLLTELKAAPSPPKTALKLLLSGLVFDPIEIYKVLDELNIAVVDDDFANGWRSAAKPRLGTGNLVEGVAEYLFYPAPCCCLYNPDNDRHAYLVDKVRQSGADGVLFWYIKFCEPDAFDRPQVMERLKQENIPAAVIDVELSMTSFDAVKTRISAFGELLEG